MHFQKDSEKERNQLHNSKSEGAWVWNRFLFQPTDPSQLIVTFWYVSPTKDDGFRFNNLLHLLPEGLERPKSQLKVQIQYYWMHIKLQQIKARMNLNCSLIAYNQNQITLY